MRIWHHNGFQEMALTGTIVIKFTNGIDTFEIATIPWNHGHNVDVAEFLINAANKSENEYFEKSKKM